MEQTQFDRSTPDFVRNRAQEAVDRSATFLPIKQLRTDCFKNVKRLRLLNKAITRWGNSSFSERKMLLDELEARLSTINGSSDSDVVQLREILRESVGALSPPRAQQTSSAEMEMSARSMESLQMSAQLQQRARLMVIKVISLWRELWLEEVQIEAVLKRARQLIGDFEASDGDVGQACAGKQWSRLKEVLRPECPEGSPPVLGSTAHALGSNPTQRRGKRPRHASRCASSEGGSYTPSDYVQGLTHVQKLEEGVRLHCSQCGHVIMAHWYLVVGDAVRALRPQCGHRTCKKSSYLSVTNARVIHDKSDILDICEHGRRRSECVACGGRDTCKHKQVARWCTQCKRAKTANKQGRGSVGARGSEFGRQG
ncbi:unnamed protein product [Polarella glacialis]|uniref:Uncharacterized protein n=1 Tax=Polarella glacialis TaxID=89957 RepID=A0A813I085_POLGL|nr:unnamed protein product [Polarella glacialis]